MTIIQSRDTKKQTTNPPLFLSELCLSCVENFVLNPTPLTHSLLVSSYKSEPVSKTKFHKLKIHLLVLQNMVPTPQLKYVLLLFYCTFAFNLLSTPACALNIGAETTGVAVSVVTSCLIKLSNSKHMKTFK